MAEPMRIQRALARAGVLSRRKAEELVAIGRVTVNGVRAQVGQTVDPDRDVIAVDGDRIGAPAPLEWFLLNKPAGVITSRHDPEGRRTVFDLVPQRPGLTYVGRLDFLTEGALLLTTDGAAAHRLTHPSHEVERTYVASVLGEGDLAAEEARHGVQLDDGIVRPKKIRAEKVGRGRWDLTITIAEGRNREVRRLCEALGLEVDRLLRIKFGPVELGELATGKVRSLTKAELKALEKL
ncbi:MAG: rRNA pseudouridine synthase [Gemmatimonadaceae bacterium]|nr:rRNA pseudouridine synthase [Gemmatimonadaceae bacterium]